MHQEPASAPPSYDDLLKKAVHPTNIAVDERCCAATREHGRNAENAEKESGFLVRCGASGYVIFFRGAIDAAMVRYIQWVARGL